MLPTIAFSLFSNVLTLNLFRKGLKDNFTQYCPSTTSNDPSSIGKLMETDGVIFRIFFFFYSDNHLTFLQTHLFSTYF